MRGGIASVSRERVGSGQRTIEGDLRPSKRSEGSGGRSGRFARAEDRMRGCAAASANRPECIERVAPRTAHRSAVDARADARPIADRRSPTGGRRAAPRTAPRSDRVRSVRTGADRGRARRDRVRTAIDSASDPHARARAEARSHRVGAYCAIRGVKTLRPCSKDERIERAAHGARSAGASGSSRSPLAQAGRATTTLPVTWSPSRLRPRSEISIVPTCSSRPVTEPSRVIVSPG